MYYFIRTKNKKYLYKKQFKPKYRNDKEEIENLKPKLILKHHKDLRTSFNDLD